MTAILRIAGRLGTSAQHLVSHLRRPRVVVVSRIAYAIATGIIAVGAAQVVGYLFIGIAGRKDLPEAAVAQIAVAVGIVGIAGFLTDTVLMRFKHDWRGLLERFGR